MMMGLAGPSHPNEHSQVLEESYVDKWQAYAILIKKKLHYSQNSLFLV